MVKSFTVYCHFSFKRPKGKDYGLFAVAFYKDFEGTKQLKHTVRRIPLWKNHQFVTAIQAYENALNIIFENQGLMKSARVNQVMLVTDNSTLAGWIVDHKKNKAYTEYLNRAVKAYRVGGPKEIVLGIGLCEPRDAEKSYKYCKEEYVDDERTKPKIIVDNNKNKGYQIDLGSTQYESVIDIIDNDPAIPDIAGMEEKDASELYEGITLGGYEETLDKFKHKAEAFDKEVEAKDDEDDDFLIDDTDELDKGPVFKI